ncbi:hypothetical protein Y1Q_0007012 [Alligator mississippiensis]|uniref:Uncharacterized protein n=1 Tax=Alligator mississippiensis TaxID=8496 RepID=A0A151M643_ALLMI|nr:hypothetical protein Y1Q_0007012 [Alligator mississippiensis]
MTNNLFHYGRIELGPPELKEVKIIEPQDTLELSWISCSEVFCICATLPQVGYQKQNDASKYKRLASSSFP